MADNSAINALGQFKPADPLDSANKAAALGNTIANNALIKQQTINAGIAGQQAGSDLQQSLNGHLARASLALANQPDQLQTPEAYKAEIDRQVAINPGLANIAQVWKSQITDDATPSQLKQQALQHAMALLDPTTQMGLGPSGQVQFINSGGQQIPTQVPGPMARALGANVAQQPGAIDNTLPPQIGQQLSPNGGGPGIPGMVQRSVGGGYGVPPPVGGNALQSVPAPIVPPVEVAPVTPRVGTAPDGRPMNGAIAPGYIRGLDGNFYPTQVTPSGSLTRPGQVAAIPPQARPLTPAPAPSQAPAGADPWSTSVPIGAANTVEQNQQAYRTAQTEAAGLPLANTQMIEAHNAIQSLKDSDFTTGIGSGRANKIRQLLVQLGVAPGQADNVNSAALAEKYLAAAIANKAPGSDARQDLLMHANPSVAMPSGATLPIIRQLVAANRARQAVLATAPDAVNGNSFLAHQAAQSQVLNTPEGLKALSWDFTPPDERAKILADITKRGGTALDNFQKALIIGHNNKLIGDQ